MGKFVQKLHYSHNWWANFTAVHENNTKLGQKSPETFLCVGVVVDPARPEPVEESVRRIPCPNCQPKVGGGDGQLSEELVYLRPSLPQSNAAPGRYICGPTFSSTTCSTWRTILPVRSSSLDKVPFAVAWVDHLFTSSSDSMCKIYKLFPKMDGFASFGLLWSSVKSSSYSSWTRMCEKTVLRSEQLLRRDLRLYPFYELHSNLVFGTSAQSKHQDWFLNFLLATYLLNKESPLGSEWAWIQLDMRQILLYTLLPIYERVYFYLYIKRCQEPKVLEFCWVHLRFVP